jgi:hypothetical protein
MNSTLADNLLALVIDKEKQEENKISFAKFYHVLRENNFLVDVFANQAITLKMGDIVINGKVHNQPIP